MKKRLRTLKWLYPGIGVKRWVILLALGIMLSAWGLTISLRFDLLDNVKFYISSFLYILTRHRYVSPHQAGFAMMGVGLILIGLSIRKLNRSLLSVLEPDTREKLVDILYEKSTIGKGAKVVILGGGTGLSTILRGLKKYTTNITVGVTVTDDGGHSGILREELDVLPPGDLRNCLVALADTEPVMKEVMQYRFSSGQLKGHNIGNLFITALAEISQSYTEAMRLSSKVLAVRGEVIPSCQDIVRLKAVFEDGEEALGETAIVKARKSISKIELEPKGCLPTSSLIAALKQADLILLGPGSLYTSVIPHLLIPDLRKTLHQAKGIKLYICNVMTQPGETDSFSASDHIEKVLHYLEWKGLDAVLVNVKKPSRETLQRYEEHGQSFVVPDREKLESLPIRIFYGDLVDEQNLVRHDAEKTLEVIFSSLS